MLRQIAPVFFTMDKAWHSLVDLATCHGIPGVRGQGLRWPPAGLRRERALVRFLLSMDLAANVGPEFHTHIADHAQHRFCAPDGDRVA